MVRMPSPFSLVPALLVAVLLVGCSNLDVPRADNYPATGQKKARAVHHWNVLADDVAARVAEKIVAWPAGEYPIHVKVADNSSFNQGFLSLLRVRLLDRGVVLSVVPTDVELEVQTQLVQHEATVPEHHGNVNHNSIRYGDRCPRLFQYGRHHHFLCGPRRLVPWTGYQRMCRGAGHLGRHHAGCIRISLERWNNERRPDDNYRRDLVRGRDPRRMLDR